MHETKKKHEKAILIGIQTQDQDIPIDEYLDELEQLCFTSGANAVKRFTQKLEHPNPKTFVGTGKIEEIAEFCKAESVDIAIFDDDLSPAQKRNVEQILTDVKVLTRTHLILDIFAKNAKTAQAKTQVELAQSIFMLPRLTGLWTHLSKQKGGIGMKGPGETEIETDRRALRNRISLLKEKLEHIDKIGKTQRSARDGMYRAALVGYTNVGKSTIMNLLSRSDVLVENKLFATLDATVRKVVFPFTTSNAAVSVEGELIDLTENIPILLSDTVGFIRKLPTLLVESFKSTLAEALEADILIHVVDISNPKFEDQMIAVKETLHSIGASNKPEIIVFNKVDAFKENDDFFVGNTGLNIRQFEASWIAKENAPAVFISAKGALNIAKLREMIVSEIIKASPKQFRF